MKAVKKIVDTVLQWFSIIIVVVMTVLVTYQVITRYIFNNPSAVSESLARYVFVWLTMFGGAYVFGKREHMNLSFASEKLSARGKIVLSIVTEALIAFFAVTVMTYGGKLYADMQLVQIDPSLNIPMAYVYFALPASGVLILFYAACNITNFVQQLQRRN
jgi:TRAP-type C4-dicarboxylate transport system permease small subunit